MNLAPQTSLWAVRLSPSGQLLASHLHHAEAQSFAAAWNRVEATPTENAQAVPDEAAARAEEERPARTSREAAAGVRRSRAG